MPQWFTMDLCVKAELSRIKHYHASGEVLRGSAPEIIEIWGTNAYAADGSWDSWTLLGQFTEKIPSGASTANANDKDYSVNKGYDLIFEPGVPAVRYIRWKCIKNFENSQAQTIAELTFFGKPQGIE
jgi:hypothetical protein